MSTEHEPEHVLEHVPVHVLILISVEFAFRRGRYIGLSPKTYFAFDEENGAVKKGAKGVGYTEAKKLRLETFIDVLYNDGTVLVTSRELRRNNKHQMIYYETQKNALNSLFRKYRVQSDRISCLPLCKDGKIV